MTNFYNLEPHNRSVARKACKEARALGLRLKPVYDSFWCTWRLVECKNNKKGMIA